MLSETLERVKEYWKDEDLPVEQPLSRSELDDRLNNLGVKATDEIVDVFSALNGFKDMDMDDELFSFWPIDRMIEENRNCRYVKDKRYIQFADFLISSFTFAFKQDESPFATIHCQYSSNHIVKVADSFEEFFEYYLSKDPRLSGGFDT